jgi:hypothetical protein
MPFVAGTVITKDVSRAFGAVGFYVFVLFPCPFLQAELFLLVTARLPA